MFIVATVGVPGSGVSEIRCHPDANVPAPESPEGGGRREEAASAATESRIFPLNPAPHVSLAHAVK